jgi:hypothetical protein
MLILSLRLFCIYLNENLLWAIYKVKLGKYKL